MRNVAGATIRRGSGSEFYGQTTNLMPDDRRSLTIRLSVLQYRVAVAFRGARGRLLDLPDRAAREVPRDRREQPAAAAAAAGAARRAARSRRQGPGREPEHLQHRAGPRADQERRRRAARARRRRPASARRSCSDTVNRRRREPTYRPIVLIENATREQVHRRVGAAPRAARHHLPGSAVAALPGQRHGGAPVRLRRRGDRRRSCSAPTTTASSRARIVGQAGVELAYNKMLMGKDGSQDRSSSTASAARSGELRARQLPIDRPSAAADHRLRRPEVDRGRVRRQRLQRRRGGASIRATARCSASPAVPPTIRTPSRPASIARRGRRSTATASSRCRTARCRASIRRGRPSRWRSAWPASKKG